MAGRDMKAPTVGVTFDLHPFRRAARYEAKFEGRRVDRCHCADDIDTGAHDGRIAIAEHAA